MRLAIRVVFALACSSVACAQSAPDAVALIVPDCLGTSSSAVKKLVALELAPHLQVIEQGAVAELVGTVECVEPHAVISVSDDARATPLRVELDLAAAAPEARERLLALTLAELITTSQLEHAAAASAAAAEEKAAQAAVAEKATQFEQSEDDAPDDDASAARAHPLQLWVAPSFSVAGEPTAPMFGGDLGASHVVGPLLLSLDLQAQFGQSVRTSSEVALRVLSACVGVAPLLLDRESQLSVGVGLRVGHVAMSATAQRAELEPLDFSGFWLGPLLLAAWHLALADHSALRLSFEAGYLARSVVGLDERAGERMALRGVWLTASLGFAFRMP